MSVFWKPINLCTQKSSILYGCRLIKKPLNGFLFIFISFNSRSAYTDQIMEILNKVSKQKSETKKVIEDIHGIQKDINMLEGKLSRTYADVDHRLFEQAKRDKTLIPAYR